MILAQVGEPGEHPAPAFLLAKGHLEGTIQGTQSKSSPWKPNVHCSVDRPIAIVKEVQAKLRGKFIFTPVTGPWAINHDRVGSCASRDKSRSYHEDRLGGSVI